MKKLICCLFIFLLTFAKTCISHEIDGLLKDCLKDKYSTADMIACTISAQKKWKEEVTNNYRILLKILSDQDAKIKLRDSQEKWIAYVEAEKMSIVNTYDLLEGTLWFNIREDEIMELYKYRAIELKNRIDQLQKYGQ